MSKYISTQIEQRVFEGLVASRPKEANLEVLHVCLKRDMCVE